MHEQRYGLTKLNISDLRNITNIELDPALNFNLFYGDNGSGKSSILESIYLLGHSKSFRSKVAKPLIQDGQGSSTVYCELLSGLHLGITKYLSKPHQIKISNTTINNSAQLALSLPIQLLNSDTFRLLEGSAKFRRQFLDWGVFHVEPSFLKFWRKSQKALQNRNSLLKKQSNRAEIDPWTYELTINSHNITLLRKKYLADLLPIIKKLLAVFLPTIDLEISYFQGWDEGLSLEELYVANTSRDYRYGYTTAGIHRSDLKIRVNKFNAIDILSRGQQKLLICALKIAQGTLYNLHSGSKCIYLIDDLPSELDFINQNKLCSVLLSLDSQVFLACVDSPKAHEYWGIQGFANKENKLFHVKHGKIIEIEV